MYFGWNVKNILYKNLGSDTTVVYNTGNFTRDENLLDNPNEQNNIEL